MGLLGTTAARGRLQNHPNHQVILLVSFSAGEVYNCQDLARVSVNMVGRRTAGENVLKIKSDIWLNVKRSAIVFLRGRRRKNSCIRTSKREISAYLNNKCRGSMQLGWMENRRSGSH